MSRPREGTETEYGCGHPRTPENTHRGGKAYPAGRCGICNRETALNAYQQRYRDTLYRAPVAPPRVRLDLSYDPAVLRYRSEKERRASRPAPLMDQAKAEFSAVMEAAKVVGRGGRPRGASARYDFSKLRNDDA